MTDTKPSLDEQIAKQKARIVYLAHKLHEPDEMASEQSILTSLEELKRIHEAEMPEPVAFFAGQRLTPKGTLEFYGYLNGKHISLENGAKLYGPELLAYAQRKEAELSDAVHLNDEQAQRVYKAEQEKAALIAGLREIATCESKVKGDVVDIAKSILWKYDR